MIVMNAYRMMPVVDGYQVSSTIERYLFQTQEFAETFCKLLNDYERLKYNAKLSESSITLTGSFSNSNIVPLFYIPFPGVTYRLDLSKSPNLFTKVLLNCIGFKK